MSGLGSNLTNSSTLYIGNTGTGTLAISNGGTVSNTSSYIGNFAGSNGTVTVSGPGSNWTNSSTLTVANAGTGTLAISNGGTVSNTNSFIGNVAGSNGTVTVSGPGSKWTNSSMSIGNAGTGKLAISSGGTVAASGTVTIGSASTGKGALAVDGSGSTLSALVLTVANFGTGTLAISNGGAVSNTAGIIGNFAGSNGTVTVSGPGSNWTNSSTLTVGNAGTGTLAISNGGTVSNTNSFIGNAAGSNGAVTVSGPGSKWTNSSTLTVANAGTGTLAISNGGTVSNTVGIIGDAVTGNGTVTVNGPGSSWTSSGAIVVGEAGSGTLTIANGATLKSASGIIGDAASGVGVVTIDGAGSIWDDTGDPIIGNAGKGTLTISNGGRLLSTVSVLGNLATGNGTVLVTGAGSTWTDNSTITVGNAGTGKLTVADAGLVTAAGGVVVAAQAGSAGTVNLNGTSGRQGVLQTLSLAEGSGTGTVNFDGGILRAIADNASFISGFKAGALNINGGGATIDDAGYTIATDNALTGTGGLTKTGVGTLTLNGISTYSGGTTVTAGTLVVGDEAHTSAALSGGGATTVNSGATLGGYGSVTGTVTNNGTVAVADTLAAAGLAKGNFTIDGTLVNNSLAQVGGTGIGNTLTVNSYVGNIGSTVALNTYLGSDGSPSDRLIVNGGTATGTSGLRITNVGGAGALTYGNGILVVDAINGATTASGAFTLSKPVIAGPYEYTLFRGSTDGSDAQDWFLRSTLPLSQPGSETPNYRQEVSLYTALPSMAQLYGRATLGTMHERVGEQEQLRGDSALDANRTVANGAWGRMIGIHGSQGTGSIYSDGPKFDYDISAMQVGLDVYRRAREDGGRDHAGISVAIGHLGGDVTHADGIRAGRNSFDAQTLGFYGTHFGASGWYVDAVAQVTLYNNVKALSSRTQGLESPITLSTNGRGVGASLEGGYPIQVGGGWIVEPQAQLMYQRIGLDDSADVAATVRFPTSESLAGRVGPRFARTWALEEGDRARMMTAWLRANLWHEFMGNNKTEFSSASGFLPFSSDLSGSWVELAGGFTAQLTRRTAAFAQVGYMQGTSSDRSAYSGKFGVRVNW
ncbi:autotransporter outer membrane beta-barrel domain-containing protein [Bradyrhizobium sp. 143]|uniref:autotransporter outer membrane beta-barrel domain-containing protein n=1 Tax=Bradyrhizobium sp. 143 TaxID=2782619 RepID=UPI001FF7768B